MGLVTFISFIVVGFIPLLIYVWDYISPIESSLFTISSILTACAFFAIGILKSWVTATSAWRSVVETLFLGGIAAILAYFVGDVIEDIFL